MMFCLCALALLTLVPRVTGNNPGVKVKLTQMGLDYIVQNAIEQMLINMKIPDQTQTDGIMKYSATGLKIQYLEKLQSVPKFVPGTGVSVTVESTNLYISGNFTLQVMFTDSGTFDLIVNTLDISATVAVQIDKNGLPTLSVNNCEATIGLFDVRLESKHSRLLETLVSCLKIILRFFAEKQICPQLTTAIASFNKQLSTLNAKVSEYAEIDYSVGSAVISNTNIEFGLKGAFYNIGQRNNPPFTPTAFLLPSQNTKMFYIGISAFSINSAFLVYHNAGVFSISITDDMVPSVSPIRLSTTTLGAYIPEISKTYPDLKINLVVKTMKEPVINFEANNVILQVFSTVAAYAVQSDSKLTPLFVLNLESSIGVKVNVIDLKLALALTLNTIAASIKETNIKTFEVTKLNALLKMVIDYVVFPVINAHLAKGYPLPGYSLPSSIGKIYLENTEVAVFNDYMLIGTDIKFQENISPQHH